MPGRDYYRDRLILLSRVDILEEFMIESYNMSSTNKTRIVIIDSGVSFHKDFNNSIHGFSIYMDKEESLCVDDNFEDKLGHGTAIYGIIQERLPNAEIINIKITSELTNHIDELALLEAITKVHVMGCVDILHMSLGLNRGEHFEQISLQLKRLHDQGTLIVSAYHYQNSMTYPSYLPYVVGVDSNERLTSKNDYFVLDQKSFNLEGYGRRQTVHWLNNTFSYEDGSSFAAAHITGIIGGLLERDQNNSKEDILRELYQNRKNKLPETQKYVSNLDSFSIKEAVIFPYFEEENILINYEEKLNFKVVGLYCFEESNKFPQKVIKGQRAEYVVCDITQLDYNSFDTIILAMENLGYKRPYETKIFEIVKNCVKNDKNIFAYDLSYFDYYISIGGKTEKFYCPGHFKNDISGLHSGKLFLSSIPVVGFISSKYNYKKKSIVLELRQLMSENDLKVGQLSQNPELHFFDSVNVATHNYRDKLIFSGSTLVQSNKVIHDFEEKLYDIVFVDDYSDPYRNDVIYNIHDANISLVEFVLGTNFDTAIYFANCNENINDIVRNVTLISALSSTTILMVVLHKNSDTENYNECKLKEHDMLVCEEIEQRTGVKCIRTSEKTISMLYDQIIDFYS